MRVDICSSRLPRLYTTDYSRSHKFGGRKGQPRNLSSVTNFLFFFYTVQSQPRFCSVGQRMAQFRAKAMYVFCSQIYRNGAGNGIYGGGKLRGRGRADRDNKHSTLLFSYKLPLFCRLNRLGSTHFHQSRVFTQIYTVSPKFISFFLLSSSKK